MNNENSTPVSVSVPVTVIDQDDTEYLLKDNIMCEQLSDSHGSDRYYFDIREAEYIPLKPWDDEEQEEFKVFCYIIDDEDYEGQPPVILPPKAQADEFAIEVSPTYDNLAKLYIGCRCFRHEEADKLYKWLSQRQDIKEFIDREMVRYGLRSFLYVEETENNEAAQPVA